MAQLVKVGQRKGCSGQEAELNLMHIPSLDSGIEIFHTRIKVEMARQMKLAQTREERKEIKRLFKRLMKQHN